MPDAERKIRLATRRSALSLIQSRDVADRLTARWPGLRVVLVPATPPGDRDKHTPLTILGKGVFVKGVEELLLNGAADIAVHSLKDVPTDETVGLDLAAFPVREDPRDGLICRVGRGLASLPPGARVGTGSPRRAAQLLAIRPDLAIAPIRGNLDTRIAKLYDGQYEAIAVALAGLIRLGRLPELTQSFTIEECTPAVGQGALGVQCRSDDPATKELLAAIDDRDCRAECLAERTFLATLGNGCQIPAGAVATARGDELWITGVVASADGRDLARLSHRGSADEPELVGRELADRLVPHSPGILAAAPPRK